MDQDTFLTTLYVLIDDFASLKASMRNIVLGRPPRCRVAKW
jgi:hypothetical protein